VLKQEKASVLSWRLMLFIRFAKVLNFGKAFYKGTR
jgi:hypothetical protein